MSDNFKFSQDAVLSVHSDMVTKTGEFKAAIDKFKVLVDEIGSSASWKDAEVKTSFINSINSYVTYFNSSYEQLTGYADYLNKKADATSEFEENYSKG